MNVQMFLLARTQEGLSPVEALGVLNKELSIKTKIYEEEGLVLLDYHMIDSPKLDPIVIECRSLILEVGTWKLVSRKFDRFFNYGEAQDYYSDFDVSRCIAYEKADGSLIGIYNYKDKWHISTRGMAFAEGEHVMGGTFKKKVLEAFMYTEDEFQEKFNAFDKGCTFVFEYTSPENRIVTKYEEPEMVLLSCNDGYKEFDYPITAMALDSLGMKNFRTVRKYPVTSMSEIVELANTLPNLQEGFVLYDPASNKRMKVKSALYVVAHSLRGEDHLPTKKNLLKLTFTGELDEFIAYFPEWKEKAREVTDEVTIAKYDLAMHWDNNKHIECQKDFAIAIKAVPHNSVLFQARKLGVDISEVWKSIPLEKKINMFM